MCSTDFNGVAVKQFRSKKFFFYLLSLSSILFLSDSNSQSTCTASISAGNDTVLCTPATIQLHGSTTAAAADIRSISWLPTTGLSNAFILNPNANITSAITYHLTVSTTSDSNLIVNGNFSA